MLIRFVSLNEVVQRSSRHEAAKNTIVRRRFLHSPKGVGIGWPLYSSRPAFFKRYDVT